MGLLSSHCLLFFSRHWGWAFWDGLEGWRRQGGDLPPAEAACTPCATFLILLCAPCCALLSFYAYAFQLDLYIYNISVSLPYKIYLYLPINFLPPSIYILLEGEGGSLCFCAPFCICSATMSIVCACLSSLFPLPPLKDIETNSGRQMEKLAGILGVGGTLGTWETWLHAFSWQLGTFWAGSCCAGKEEGDETKQPH